MIEKGNINLGLVASIVIGLLIGYLLITIAGRLMRPVQAQAERGPAPTTPSVPKKEPIGFKADDDESAKAGESEQSAGDKDDGSV